MIYGGKTDPVLGAIIAMIPLFRPLDPAALKRYWPEEYEKMIQKERIPVSPSIDKN